MDFKQSYSITPRYLTSPSKRRSGRPMSPGPVFIVVHDTGNAGSTADQNFRYYENSRDKMSASAHIFVDDREIIECIPALTGPPEKAWHVLYDRATDNQLFGHNANDAAIAVEYCFGGKIDADEAYRRYVWLIAYACFKHGIDPHGHIVGHHVLDPGRKTDPVTGLLASHRSYEQLLRDVVSEYDACLGIPSKPAVTPSAGTMIATVRLNLRAEAPSTRARVARTVLPGNAIACTGVRRDGDAVAGNRVWMQEAGTGLWFWSGGVRPGPAVTSPSPQAGPLSIGSALILAEAVNIRPHAGTAEDPIGTLERGATADVIGETDGWLRIVAPPGMPGPTAYISSNPKLAKLQRVASELKVLRTIRMKGTVNVRTAPNPHAEDIGDAEADSEFEVIREAGAWLEIRWNDGRAFITSDPRYHARVDIQKEEAERAAVPAATVPGAGTDIWTASEVPELRPPRADVHLPLVAAMIEGTPHPTTPFRAREDLVKQLISASIRTPEEFEAADGFILDLPPSEQGDFYELLTLLTPYFNQRDNDSREGSGRLETTSGRMCNLTSLAMLLARQGCRVPARGNLLQPEDRLETIRKEKNFGPRTTYEGWGNVAKQMNMKARWLKGAPAVCPMDWWLEEPLSYIRRGYSIMASITGHIVAVVGIQPGWVIVHDPYGSNQLLPGGDRKWLGRNGYDAVDGINQAVGGRWLRHETSALEKHRWNWVIAMRNTALGGG